MSQKTLAEHLLFAFLKEAIHQGDKLPVAVADLLQTFGEVANLRTAILSPFLSLIAHAKNVK